MAHAGASSGISAIEEYRALVDKAYNKFCRLRDFPPYGRNKWEYYFHKAFQIYSRLWRYQQEHRQKLVDTGLKRWEIGEIASRIGQLYHSYYLRTSEATFLCESYIFYEAILSREYFKEASKDLSLANKQLRYYARFIVICLLLNKRDVVQHLVKQLRVLVEEYASSFQVNDGKEWKIVYQEICRFMKADSPCENTRPLRYSLLFDPHPSSLPRPVRLDGTDPLRLQDAVLASYYHNEVRFSELTLDTFRMLQAIEWEPSGSFYRMRSLDAPSSSSAGAGSFPAPNRMDDIVDPGLPPNPHKYILYRPTVPQLLIVLATAVEELSSNCILLLHLSASGKAVKGPAPFPTSNSSGNMTSEGLQTEADAREANSAVGHQDSLVKEGACSSMGGGIWLGSRKNAKLNYLYPSDILPFTRRPLFIIIDSDNSSSFERISGEERGEAAVLLLSPTLQPTDDKGSSLGSGSLFTMFLTAPLLAFLRLLGISIGQLSQASYERLEKIIADMFLRWGETMAASTSMDIAWGRVLCDPFLRQIVLRFVFCRACFSQTARGTDLPECLPRCRPPLPVEMIPHSDIVEAGLFQLSHAVGMVDHFMFSTNVNTEVDTTGEKQVAVSSNGAAATTAEDQLLEERLSVLAMSGLQDLT